MIVSELTILEIKDLDIVQVISDYGVELKVQGSKHVGLSPFSNEKTPSFHVDDIKQLFYCFSTNKGGDIISFVKELLDIPFTEAVLELANKYGIELPKSDPSSDDIAKSKILSINEKALSLFQENRDLGSQDHLNQFNRLNSESIFSWGIGLAAKESQIQEKLNSIDLKNLIDASLVSFKNNVSFDYFRNRLIIPIRDLSSQLIGFGGRALDDSFKSKYLNSKETALFKKRNILFGLDKARRTIASGIIIDGQRYLQHTLILCEGYLDVIKLHEHGVTNAVATLGTSLSENQCQLIKRFAKKVLIFRDSDEAGQSAVVKDIKQLLKLNLCSDLLIPPKGMDPFDVAEEKKDQTINWILGNATDAILAYAKSQYGSFETPQEKAAFRNELGQMLDSIEENNLREEYTFSIQKELGITIDKSSKNEKLLKNGSKSTDFLRIGTDYYKKTRRPLSTGERMEVIVKWTSQAIRDDLPEGLGWKGFTGDIPRYDGFTCVPDHLSYKRSIHSYYNTYHPFPHELSNYSEVSKDEIKYSLKYANHIFGDQIEYGLDYLKLLLEKPRQKLPIFCLVSLDGNTGKSTFLNWLKVMFGDNATINTSADFESNFNSDWSSKLLIMLDEGFLSNAQMGEKLKFLSTAKFIKSESKGKDKVETEFFGKFVICSNYTDTFIKISKRESRYWVRSLPTITIDPLFAEKLKAEIPKFLQYLMNRDYYNKCKTRLWFDPNELVTPELLAVKDKSRSPLEIELEQYILDQLEEFDLAEIKFDLSDMLNAMKARFNKFTTWSQIREIIKDNWNMESVNGTYKKYKWMEGMNGQEPHLWKDSKSARHFTFNRDTFKSIIK